MCEAGRVLDIPRRCVGPRHTRIARQFAERGHTEWHACPIHFLGGLAKGGMDAYQFYNTFIGLQCEQGLPLTPNLITLEGMGISPFKSHHVADSALYGDAIAESRGLYDLGHFDLQLLANPLHPTEPAALDGRYSECGCRAAADHFGFRQFYDISGSIGRGVPVCYPEGNWAFGQRSLMATLSAKETLNSGRRLPLTQETGAIRPVGDRIVMVVGFSVLPPRIFPTTALPSMLFGGPLLPLFSGGFEIRREHLGGRP